MSATINEAEDAIRRRFIVDGFEGQVEYAADKVIETDAWWYIPFCWIGCAGFIVNKDDLYVNWLESSLSLEQCIWGHDRRVFCDLVDFAFAPDTNRSLAARLLSRFHYIHRTTRESSAFKPIIYQASEISAAMSDHFPIFNCHFVWFSIPELRSACENDGLRFTCELAKGI